jgi:dTDP-L-rhamnose 4-epimerase
MPQTVLITGGAGFIGSHLADNLLRHGYAVRVYDNLSAQVHGNNAARPVYLNRHVDFIQGDVRDAMSLRHAIRGVDGVFHFAAAVGVGQSMYEVAQYTEINSLGTAMLLEALIERPVGRLVVASSMSIYGEGLYRRHNGGLVGKAERRLAQLRRCDWELRDESGDPLVPVSTPETKEPSLASVYALSKFDQEKLCLMVGKAYGIPTVALRFFNAYGPRQALSNPYTGVLAIFATRLLNGRRPLVFEDGRQQRDFIHVLDVAEGCRLAYECERATNDVFNIGSGTPLTVGDIAIRLAEQLERKRLAPEITGQYRVGDIRHCFADISKARRVLGFSPRVNFEEGVRDLGVWLEGQIAADRVDEARHALEVRGLAR